MAARKRPWVIRSCMLAVLCLPGSVRAAPAGRPRTSPALSCEQAITAAEQRLQLPAGLLAAVGRVETGRTDHAGVMHPWPYTINAEGAGAFFATKQAAVAAVRALEERGVRSIDVGCVQVNLLHHPAAFVSLDEAFDPVVNTAYGARFLRRLYDEMQSWPAAVAAYHSRTPGLGAPYRARVLAIWTGGAPLQVPAQPQSPYGTWPPPGVIYGALPPPSFAYHALPPLSVAPTRP
ncbi:MAG: transglycosylase SLT domain-containing protein [Acetobacteraceae bacterium]